MDTRMTQPAMLLHSAMIVDVLQVSTFQGLHPSDEYTILQRELDLAFDGNDVSPIACALGHSVGEISALATCGSLSFPEAATLLSSRGEAMANATEKSTFPVGMSALLPVSAARVRSAAAAAMQQAREAGQSGVAVAANINSTSKTVVSGHQHVIDLVVQTLKSSLRLRAVPLPVSAPFHSPLMVPAVAAVARAVAPGRQLLQAPIPSGFLSAAFSEEDWFSDLCADFPDTVSLGDLCAFVAQRFHQPALQWDSSEEDNPANASILQRSGVPVYSNVTALPHSFGGDDAAVALALQALAPVRWHACMRNALTPSEDTHAAPNVLLEIGPGSTLTSLAKQILKDPGLECGSVSMCNLDSAASIAALVKRAEAASQGLSDQTVWQAK